MAVLSVHSGPHSNCFVIISKETTGLSLVLNLAPRQEAVGVAGGVTARFLKLGTRWCVVSALRSGHITFGERVPKFVFKRWGKKISISSENQAPYCGYHIENVTPIPD